MNSMLLKNIKYDIKCGFRYNIKKYIIVVIYILIGCILFNSYSGNTLQFIGNKDVTLMDYYIYFFAGDRAADFSEGIIPIPAVLLGLQLIISSMVGYYPVDDIYGYGKQVFIRVKTKTNWWISKCIWTFVSVLAVYVLIYVGIAIFGIVAGCDISMSYNVEIVQFMNQQYIGLVSKTDILLHMFVTPVVYSLAISFIQVTLSMVIGPLLSFLSVMIYNILGILLAHKALFFNYSMLLRNENVSGVNIRPFEGIIYMLIVAVVSIVMGIFVVNKKDLLEK